MVAKCVRFYRTIPIDRPRTEVQRSKIRGASEWDYVVRAWKSSFMKFAGMNGIRQTIRKHSINKKTELVALSQLSRSGCEFAGYVGLSYENNGCNTRINVKPNILKRDVGVL